MNSVFVQFFSVFMVLFAVIDIFGSLPFIIDLQGKGIKVKPFLTTLLAVIILFVFLLGGELILKLFGVDVSSFAVAGAIILFFLALEMVLDFHFFKQETNVDTAIVPIVFPLIAGPGCITTLISLRAEYSITIISLALALNMIIVFLTLHMAGKIAKSLGKAGLYIIQKFFGIILLAMAVKLFVSNLNALVK